MSVPEHLLRGRWSSRASGASNMQSSRFSRPAEQAHTGAAEHPIEIGGKRVGFRRLELQNAVRRHAHAAHAGEQDAPGSQRNTQAPRPRRRDSRASAAAAPPAASRRLVRRDDAKRLGAPIRHVAAAHPRAQAIASSNGARVSVSGAARSEAKIHGGQNGDPECEDAYLNRYAIHPGVEFRRQCHPLLRQRARSGSTMRYFAAP